MRLCYKKQSMKRKSLNVQKPKGTLTNNIKFQNLYSKFVKVINKHKIKNSFVVAVSGGPDSLALAGLSKFFTNQKKIKVFFVLVDHGLRKKSSEEAFDVKNLLRKNNIKLDILKNKIKISKNIQKNARDIRYKLLSSYCKRKAVKFLLTAHHQDDQIETFFIRLSRGSGIEGLSSMNEKTTIAGKINLIRPFLDIKKEDLISVAKNIFGKVLKDPANKNTKFLRTNIRNLKKILQKRGLKPDSIAHSIQNISKTKDAINFYVTKSMQRLVKIKKNETILDLKNFKKEPDEIKFRIITNILTKRTRSYYPPRSYKVINLISRFEGIKPKKCTLGGCLFEKRNNLLYVSKEL